MGSAAPYTLNKQPTTNNQQPTTNNKQQTTNNQQPTMTSEPIIIQPIEDIVVIENAIDDTRELFEIFDDPFTTGLVASFQLFDTSVGNGGLTQVVLFDQERD